MTSLLAVIGPTSGHQKTEEGHVSHFFIAIGLDLPTGLAQLIHELNGDISDQCVLPILVEQQQSNPEKYKQEMKTSFEIAYSAIKELSNHYPTPSVDDILTQVRNRKDEIDGT